MERSSYKVIGKISEGGFGEIFKVKSLKSNEYFALKHIKYRGSINDQTYIQNEIAALSLLKHRNIIAFCEVIVKRCGVNIVMEYANGGNLEDYIIRKKKLQSTIVCDIFVQILRAVDFCHQHYIGHRDLTPSNVLLTDNMTIKLLADFGLSVNCKDPDGTLLLCDDYLGNKLYLAPEVIREHLYDPMIADIWSLGVLLIFIVFGDIPFDGSDEEILLQQQTIRNMLNTWCSNEIIPDLFIHSILDLSKLSPAERPTISAVLDNWEFNKFVTL